MSGRSIFGEAEFFRGGCFFQAAISGTVERAGESMMLLRLFHPYSSPFQLSPCAAIVYFIAEGVLF